MAVEDVEEKSELIKRKVMKYFGLFMGTAYIVVGVLILMIPKEMFSIDPFQINVVGSLFIFYGLYRFYKTYRQYFQRRA